MSPTIRRATVDDIPVLLDLMEEFHGESGRPLDREWARASFASFLGDPSYGAAWIGYCDGQPAGHAVLTVRFSMEFGGLDGFIDDLFVRPVFRRRGVGRHLLGALFDECRGLGLLAIHVETAHDNVPARGLYEGCGLLPGTDGRLMLTADIGKLCP